VAEVQTEAELQGAFPGWLEIYDLETRRGNDDDLRDELAGTLGDDSGAAVLKSARLVSLEGVEAINGEFKTTGTFSVESEFRTNSDAPDTFGPNDVPDYKADLVISAVLEEGEWRITDVTVYS
jgi:hypothetical protein